MYVCMYLHTANCTILVFAAVLVSFGQNYTVTEGDTVYISLHTSIFHEIDFAVTVRFVLDKPRLGIAVGEFFCYGTYVCTRYKHSMQQDIQYTIDDNMYSICM